MKRSIDAESGLTPNGDNSVNKMTKLVSLLNYFFAATSAFLAISIIIVLISISSQNKELLERVDHVIEENRVLLEENTRMLNDLLNERD